ncbi:MAG TPA: isocitrate lyase/phosphoenolpyruvate mutase family protein [Alphaproteobacteria bacterium]|nr:isocitrate lyase/phosphoenolpyruvate mutase family protein [Alphaproteobacteria bacterium]
MGSREEKVAAFRDMHRAGCFVIPNPWDVGSAQVLAGAGFKALATTSSGYAFSVGKPDGEAAIGRDEALAYAARIAAGVEVPVSADFEDGYGDTPEAVAETVRLAAEAGLAGMSVEDSNPRGPEPSRSIEAAAERVAAATEAARRHNVVLTARADGMLHGSYGLDEAIDRLVRFADLGADVVFAPGIKTLDELRRVCAAVDRPVNHLISVGTPGAGFAEVAAAGVRRISIGGALAMVAGAALRNTGLRLMEGDFAPIRGLPGWDALRGR